MKFFSIIFLIILVSCNSSGGGGSSSGGGSATEIKSYMFFNANLTGVKSLYVTSSVSEDPVEIGQEVSYYINMENDYLLYVKKNSSNVDSPYLYNYKTKTHVDIRSTLSISVGTNMNLSKYEFKKGSDSVSYGVLSFLCSDDSSNNICSISFTDSYKVEMLSYTNQYLGSQVINNKVALCYFATSMKCLVSGYSAFTKEISYFTLSVPNPSSVWDHIDSVSSFDDYFMVKGGTDSDDKYYIYNSSYGFLRTTSIVNKDFVVISSDSSDLLIFGNLDGENKYWEFNFLSDALTSSLEGDGIVSPNFAYLGSDTTFYYVSITKDTKGSELYRVNKENLSQVQLTDSTGVASTTIESFHKDYIVVVENSNRIVYKNNSGSLTEVSLTFDNTEPLYILGEFKNNLIFLGSSNSYDNILMYLDSDLNEYTQVRGNSNDPEISGVRF